MKNTFTAILAIFLFSFSHAQEFPNGGMEDWTVLIPGLVAFPDGYFTSQVRAIQGAPTSASQSSDAYEGSSSLLLETPNGEFSAWAAIGTFNIADPMNPALGMDFTERPEKMRGYYKGNIEGNDIARVICLLLANDEQDTLGIGSWEWSGVEANYTMFEADFTYLSNETPDELQINFSSSYLVDPGLEEPGLTNPGNQIYFDAMEFQLASGIRVPLFSKYKINLFPNPAADFVTVEFGENLEGELVEFSIYSSSGQLLQSQQINQKLNLIDIKHIPSGTFYYQLKRLDGQLLDGGSFVRQH